jgi:hypothetical protein
MNKYKHSFKRLCQKVGIKTIKLFNLEKLNKSHIDHEGECITICKYLIPQKDTELLYSPTTGKRYIKSDEQQIFLILQMDQLTVVNHQYSYNINLHGSNVYDRICNIFDNEIEKRREFMEKEIYSNVKHSLSTIVKNLSYEQI